MASDTNAVAAVGETGSDQQTDSRFSTLRRSVRLVVECAPRQVRYVAALQLIAGMSGGLVLAAIGQTIGALTEEPVTWSGVWPWILAVGALTAVVGVLQVLIDEQQQLVSELVDKHTSGRLIASSASVAFERFDADSFYNRMERAAEGSRASASQIAWGVLGASRTVVDSVFVGAVLIVVAPIVIPIALVAYAPLYLTSRRGNEAMHAFRWSVTEDDRRRRYLLHLFGDRAAAREVRMFDLGRWLGERHDELWRVRLERFESAIRERMRHAVVGSVLASAVTAVALGLVAWLTTRGSLTLADAGIGILGVQRLASATRRFDGATAGLHRGTLQMLDYERFVAEAVEADAAREGAPVPTSIGRVDLENVSFTYPGATRPAIDQVSAQLHAGELVALVGPNGSGKSTAMMLLCGLYQPDAGRILWDGIDVGSLDGAAVRAAVAPMFQDFARYQLSALDNVVVSDFDGAGETERFTNAIAIAGASEAVGHLPAGLDTMLSRAYAGGTELSAGQWQRLATARAVFHGGPLLILDEPSADLDALAERDLLALLGQRAAEQCVLFISHRFSAVRQADRILVLDEGRLVEQGSHTELMAADGLYREMYLAQAGEAP